MCWMAKKRFEVFWPPCRERAGEWRGLAISAPRPGRAVCGRGGGPADPKNP